MNANRNTLGCYEDVPDVLVSRKESVFPMATHLDMGNNYIHNVKTPINNDQGANKSYVDQYVAKAGDAMSSDLNMGNNKITGLFQIPPASVQPPQNCTDTDMQKYINDLRKNTTFDNYASPFPIMKNFLATFYLWEYGIRKSLPTITSRWVQKRDWGLACGKLKKSLTWPIQLMHTDAKNKAFVDTGFLKLSAGTMTGTF